MMTAMTNTKNMMVLLTKTFEPNDDDDCDDNDSDRQQMLMSHFHMILTWRGETCISRPIRDVGTTREDDNLKMTL
jgi:hypothetical protein